MCQRPALHFVTSKEARSGTISTSDANDPMAIISMLFLFVKQSAFICRTFIKNGSGKGRNGCTKFLPRLSSYSPRRFFLPESRTAGGRKNPNQVQCRTLIEDDQRVRTLQMESEQDWFSGSSHEKQRFKMPDTKGKGRTFAHPRIAASGGCAPSRISFNPKGV